MKNIKQKLKYRKKWRRRRNRGKGVLCVIFCSDIHTSVQKDISTDIPYMYRARLHQNTLLARPLYFFFFCYKQSTHRTRNECGPKSRAILAVRWVFKIGCMEWVKRKRAMVFICVLYNGNIFMYIYSVFRIYV